MDALKKIRGAFPARARPSTKKRQSGFVNAYVVKSNEQIARELVYRSLDAADQAEVMSAALMIYKAFGLVAFTRRVNNSSQNLPKEEL